MKIQIENLKAKMTGRKLNLYQEADALIEFNKLIEYVEELECTHEGTTIAWGEDDNKCTKCGLTWSV